MIPAFAKAADYARALAPLGAALDIWTTEYLHFLDGDDPVFRWMSGTGLAPLHAERSKAKNARRSRRRCATRLARAYPAEADGRTLFPFRRLFVIAQMPH